ncbi:MAG: DUF3500 domain-containing protein [Planctomycetaceae bacterium]
MLHRVRQSEGLPSAWGLNVEGHHLSLNFVIEGDRVISNTPQCMCTNPAQKSSWENKSGFEVESAVLSKEEVAGSTCSTRWMKHNTRSRSSPERLCAGTPQRRDAATSPIRPSASPLVNSARNSRTSSKSLISENTPTAGPVAKDRWPRRSKSGWQQVHFAWTGATKPGIGHYYRVQGRRSSSNS